MTDTEINSSYGSLDRNGLLPDDGFPASQRDPRGLLNADVIKTFVATATAAGKIPRPPTIGTNGSEGKQIDDYMAKDRVFIDGLKAEYCYYDSRYRYALTQLISKIQAGYTDTNQQNAQLIQTYLRATQSLNQKLNDLTQISNEITRSRLQFTQDQNVGINSLNTELASRSDRLKEQNKILSSQQATTILYKDMVKYTKERADSTNNLLSAYSFMNVVVLGLLFYLYRSASA
jgi:hypothetical protein